MKLKAAATLATLAIMIALTACAPEYPTPENEIPKASRLAGALYRSYVNNPVHFQAEIKDDIVKAQGKVQKIQTDGSVRFKFNGFAAFQEILTCQFKDQSTVVKLSKGEHITIQGRISSVSTWATHKRIAAHLSSCQLVENQHN